MIIVCGIVLVKLFGLYCVWSCCALDCLSSHVDLFRYVCVSLFSVFRVGWVTLLVDDVLGNCVVVMLVYLWCF